MYIYQDEWKRAVSNSDSELNENIPVENLCSLCILVWRHNGSCAFYGSGYGTTIVNKNNKLLQRDLETKLVIAQCYMCHVIIVTIVSLVSTTTTTTKVKEDADKCLFITVGSAGFIWETSRCSGYYYKPGG